MRTSCLSPVCKRQELPGARMSTLRDARMQLLRTHQTATTARRNRCIPRCVKPVTMPLWTPTAPWFRLGQTHVAPRVQALPE
jgi:hypothetical protein